MDAYPGNVMTRHAASAACWGVLLGVACLPASTRAADLVIASEGRCGYQIVVPDRPPTAEIGDCIRQAARLLETAFRASGFTVPVVPEAERDPGRPAICLGDTAAARAAGVDTRALVGWQTVVLVTGHDVIVAGHDAPARGETDNPRRPNWDRVGTVKAAKILQQCRVSGSKTVGGLSDRQRCELVAMLRR